MFDWQLMSYATALRRANRHNTISVVGTTYVKHTTLLTQLIHKQHNDISQRASDLLRLALEQAVTVLRAQQVPLINRPQICKENCDEMTRLQHATQFRYQRVKWERTIPIQLGIRRCEAAPNSNTIMGLKNLADNLVYTTNHDWSISIIYTR